LGNAATTTATAATGHGWSSLDGAARSNAA
jgi:hypothetical protein